MPVSGTIADGMIKIALQGFEATKEKLATLEKSCKGLGENMKNIGAASAKGFAVATGGIMAFLRAADPVRFTVFTQKLQILSMHIGTIFIPLLDRAIKWIDKLIGYFSKLSNEQKENILKWTKIALVILGLGMALGTTAAVVGKLIGIFKSFYSIGGMVVMGVGKLIGMIRALTVSIGILEATTGVGLILVLAGAAVAVFALLKATGALDPIIESLGNAFGSLQGEFLEPLIEIMKELATVMVGTFNQILPVIKEVFSKLIGMVLQLLPTVMELIKSFAKLYAMYVQTMAKVYAGIIESIAKVIPTIMALAATIIKTVEQMMPIFTQLAAIFGEVVGIVAELAGELMALYVEVVAGLVTELVNLGKTFWDVFGDAIIAAVKAMVNQLRQTLEVIKSIVEAAKKMYDIYQRLRGRSTSTEKAAAADAANKERADKSKKNEKKDPKFAPMAGFGKVEMYGLEEAFRKAQSGANFDPEKMARAEQLKLQREGNASAREIAANTAKGSRAEQTY